MGIYNVPRDVKGEGRILTIFSYKALIFTVIGLVIGLIFYSIFNSIGLKYVGLVILAIFAIIGYSIATFKIPDINTFEITRKTGGEKIDDVILRAIKFKMKKNRIYVYTKEKEENK